MDVFPGIKATSSVSMAASLKHYDAVKTNTRQSGAIKKDTRQQQQLGKKNS